MTTTLKSLIEEFSPKDQLYIEQKSEALAQDMISHADSLAQVRAALMKTQDEVAKVLNVKQNAVAQLEKRSDLLISTLRKYVEAMGGELAVAVRTGAGTVIMLDSLSSLAAMPETDARPAPKKRRTSRSSEVPANKQGKRVGALVKSSLVRGR